MSRTFGLVLRQCEHCWSLYWIKKRLSNLDSCDQFPCHVHTVLCNHDVVDNLFCMCDLLFMVKRVKLS